MPQTTVLHHGSIDVVDYRCVADVDTSLVEVHDVHSLSYVRRGSFSCSTRGVTHDFVAGSLMVGNRNDEFSCRHDHHRGGDECLSFRFSPEAAEQLGAKMKSWRIGHVPPIDALVVLGELAQAAANGHASIGLDEVATLFARRFAQLVEGRSASDRTCSERERRKAIESAQWIELHAHESLSLDVVAAQAGMSPFHLLRTFGRVNGVTPHQYLLRLRLGKAARLLASEERSITDVALDVGFSDLSNFVRTFRRAAGMSPREFRKTARGKRASCHAELSGFIAKLSS